MRARAAADPPEAVPYHCKPWLDAQSLGWTLFYGYLTSITLSRSADDKIAVGNGDQLAAETNQPRVVDQFAAAHFGLGCGYTLATPPGFCILLLPEAGAPAGLNLVSGLIESDWYPRQLFLVFELPAPGVTITLEHRVPLARAVIVPRHDGLTAAPLAGDELAALQAERETYLAEEATTPSRWQAAGGQTFTHLYRQWSARFRRRHSGDEA